MEQFLNTFVNIAATIITFAGAFYGAYIVYLRGQRDKYREDLIKDFQKLNGHISNFSILEDIKRPPRWSWFPPIGKVYLILERESWKKSPMETLEESIKKLEDAYRKTLDKESKLMSEVKGRIPARGALYLEVKFALNDVISTLYREFPPPPGDYKYAQPGNIPYAIKSYVKSDFPANKEAFLKWAERYNLYYSGIVDLYYRIRPIMYTLKQISIEEIEQHRETGHLNQWQKEALKEFEELSAGEINYYESVFQYLRHIKEYVDIIVHKIVMYDKYRSKFLFPVIFFLFLAAIFGIAIPLYMLSPFVLEQILTYQQILSLFTSLSFGVSIGLAIVFIYLDLR